MKKDKQMQTQTITPEIEEPKSRVAKARRLVNLLKVNYVQQIIVLREIRDGEYFLDLGYNSIEELITTELPFSISAAKRLLIVSDSFGTDSDVERLIGADNLKELATIARNPELMYNGGGKVITENGEEYSLEDCIEDVKAQEKTKNKNEHKKIEKELQKAKKRLDEIQDQSSEIEKSYQNEISILKQKIDAIAKSSSLDPERMRILSGKKDALILIQEKFAQVNLAFGQLADIPDELRDPELASSLVQVITAIESGTKALREDWASLLFLPTAEEVI